MRELRTMTPAELLKPIIGGGIRSVNFFNGRLLSGEDMSREQEANRETHKMVGRAIGDGIAYGLEVSRAAGSGAAAVVTVQPGLAMNRNGEALRLPNPISLSLVRPQNGNGTAVTDGFSSCTPFQSGVYVSGSGVYLLVMSPARATEGRAPVSGLQNSAADCNTKYTIDGVQFRLIQLDMTANELNDRNHLQNLVAYKCFSLGNGAQFVKDPLGVTGTPGLLETLRPNRLTDCDVPLAVLFWTASDGVGFIDMWSVRRRTAHPAAATGWGPVTRDRRPAEAEAMFLQFQDQVEQLRTNLILPLTFDARASFSLLPAVGLIQLGDSASRGFNELSFFAGQTFRGPVYINGARLESLIRASTQYAPIDLNSHELIWLYLVRENGQAIDKGGSGAPPRCLVFASGHIPYRGESQFDLAHWDYSNY